MKKLLLVLIVVFLTNISIFAQSTGDYGSAGVGPANWSSASSWVICVTPGGFGDATVAGSAPVGTENIFIQTGHTITVDAAITGINGYIKNSGVLTIGSGSLTFTTGTYEHAIDGGTIPTATWGVGSTCLITGIISSDPGNSNQNFHNVTWNCASQAGNRGFAWNGNTIYGNVSLLNSNGTQARMTNVTGTVAITIKGNINIASGLLNTNILTTSGSSTLTNITLTIEGDLNLDGGTFSISNNSTMVITSCYLYGNVNITTSRFGKSNSTNTSRFYFAKSGTQIYSAVTPSYYSAPSFTVNSGSILRMGTNVISSTGSFVLSSGATLESGHANGINGNITCTGANGGGNLFSTGANYTYNGSVAQVTGALLPSTINDLTINNSAGVALSQAVTVNNVLSLVLGELDNSVNQVTLGPSASMNQTGGTIFQPPLPVELTSFAASVHGKKIELQWNTATEINNSGFEIERKNGTANWTKIGFVEGNGTTNAPQSYRFTDNVAIAQTYQYRLKQIDRDGKFEYSASVEANVTLTAEDFQLSQNYPNPFNPSTTFSFAMKNAELTTVKVYNLVGQEVATLFNGVAQPDQIYSMKFDGKDLSSGIYFYSLRSASRNEVKKMMLMK